MLLVSVSNTITTLYTNYNRKLLDHVTIITQLQKQQGKNRTAYERKVENKQCNLQKQCHITISEYLGLAEGKWKKMFIHQQ